MKKRLFLIIFVLFLVSGCGMKYPDLKEDAIAFEMGEIIDENDDDAAYGTIEYNGRTYVAYSNLDGTITEKDIKECIGYIVEDKDVQKILGTKDKDTRVYTLTADLENNYLMVYYVVSEIMNQPSFWRAIDTKGRKIETPSYIGTSDSNFWQ